MIERTEKEIMQHWEGDLNTPLVSICTITYNHENFIEEALDSFLMQETNFPFELVVDDDLSPDGTVDIIKKYMKKYPNIMNVNLRTKNVGSMTNFIENMQRAKGKYIALCEGDDYWTDSLKLKKQVDFLKINPIYSGCFHDCIVMNNKIDGKGEEYLRIGDKQIDKDVDLVSIINKNNIPTASIVFKNFIEDIPKYLTETSKGDYALMIMIAEHGKIKYIPEVMSVYRIHNGGIWSSKSLIYHHKEAIKFYDLLKEYFIGYDKVLDKINLKSKHTYFEISMILIREKKRVESLYYFLSSLKFPYRKNQYIRYIKEFIKSIVK